MALSMTRLMVPSVLCVSISNIKCHASSHSVSVLDISYQRGWKTEFKENII